MGKEIRLVPADWLHPKIPCRQLIACSGIYGCVCFKPMYDISYHHAFQSWLRENNDWERNGRAKHFARTGLDLEYWQYESAPPHPMYYRPEFEPGTARWFRVYENVSEGTPITPAFATKDDLIHHLVTIGDFFSGPWEHERARQFVYEGYEPPTNLLHHFTTRVS